MNDDKIPVAKAAGEAVVGAVQGAPRGAWLVVLVALGTWWATSEVGAVRHLAEQAAADAAQAREQSGRLDTLEQRQEELGRALVEATYVQTDHMTWNVRTMRWLAERLVPGEDPPAAPDYDTRMREIRRMAGGDP